MTRDAVERAPQFEVIAKQAHEDALHDWNTEGNDADLDECIIRHFVAALTAAAADARRADLEWRPIETAPKEPIDASGYGPVILLRRGDFVVSDQWKPGLPEYPLQSHWRNWPYLQPRTKPELWCALPPAPETQQE